MRLFRALYALTLLDVAATAYGVWLGDFREANPLLAPLFARHWLLGAAATLAVSVLAIALVAYLCRRRPRLVFAAWGLLAVKAWVAGMHVYWLAENLRIWMYCTAKPTW